MPNTNYLRGVRFERLRKKRWEEAGYHVIRASGSHGKFDLVAIYPGGIVNLIQCKVTASMKGVGKMVNDFQKKPPMLKSVSYNQCLEIWVRSERKLLQVFS